MSGFDLSSVVSTSQAIAFFAGCVAGSITFANDFTDKPKVLILSGWCWSYAIFNGIMAALIFSILEQLDIKILSLSFSNAQVLLATVVGIGWFKFLTSSFFSEESANFPAQAISSMFLTIKKYLYHHYSMNQMSILRPKTWDIVKNIKDEDFYNFTVQCIQLAKGISAEKGALLGENYSKLKESSSNVGGYKCTIAIDIAKIIGISLLKQIAEEQNNEKNSISSVISALDSKLMVLEKTQ